MSKHKLATRVIHAGQSPDPSTGAIMTPIYATSTYVQKSPGDHQGWEYSRSHNPTRDAYEKCIADLEGGIRGLAFASGMAATSAILELLDSGDHVVAGDDGVSERVKVVEDVEHKRVLVLRPTELAVFTRAERNQELLAQILKGIQ